MIATASAEMNSGDGDVFTFYVNSNAEDVNVTAVDPVFSTKVAAPMATRPYYIIGDVNHDGSINPLDASYILSAASIYEDETYNDLLPVDEANADLAHYFTACTPLHAGAADSNDNKYINKHDSQLALNYYSYLGTGSKPTVKETGYCGEVRYYEEDKK